MQTRPTHPLQSVSQAPKSCFLRGDSGQQLSLPTQRHSPTTFPPCRDVSSPLAPGTGAWEAAVGHCTSPTTLLSDTGASFRSLRPQEVSPTADGTAMAFGQRTGSVLGCAPAPAVPTPPECISTRHGKAKCGCDPFVPPQSTGGLLSPCHRACRSSTGSAGAWQHSQLPDQVHAKPSAGWEAGAGWPMSCLRVAAGPQGELRILREGWVPGRQALRSCSRKDSFRA